MEQQSKNPILMELGVKPTEQLDAEQEIERRVDFIKDKMLTSKAKTLVLGISGGVDSFLAGRLAQMTVEQLRQEGHTARFIAMRLPYGEQQDEADAQLSLSLIRPDETVTVNVKNSTDSLHDAVLTGLWEADVESSKAIGFAKGNVKARARMVAQYEVAGLTGGLVIGTDHNAEALMGFYTKHGDGACDLTPLAGLNKRQVRLLAKTLDAPELVWNKVATADLEEGNKAQLPDEIALGVSYDTIDDFLEGKPIDQADEAHITGQYIKTQHKREMPSAPKPSA